MAASEVADEHASGKGYGRVDHERYNHMHTFRKTDCVYSILLSVLAGGSSIAAENLSIDGDSLLFQVLRDAQTTNLAYFVTGSMMAQVRNLQSGAITDVRLAWDHDNVYRWIDEKPAAGSQASYRGPSEQVEVPERYFVYTRGSNRGADCQGTYKPRGRVFELLPKELWLSHSQSRSAEIYFNPFHAHWSRKRLPERQWSIATINDDLVAIRCETTTGHITEITASLRQGGNFLSLKESVAPSVKKKTLLIFSEREWRQSDNGGWYPASGRWGDVLFDPTKRSLPEPVFQREFTILELNTDGPADKKRFTRQSLNIPHGAEMYKYSTDGRRTEALEGIDRREEPAFRARLRLEDHIGRLRSKGFAVP